jgi:hypothetical protein
MSSCAAGGVASWAATGLVAARIGARGHDDLRSLEDRPAVGSVRAPGYAVGVPAEGDDTGRTTDSMVAPMRVAITGGSSGSTWSKITLP